MASQDLKQMALTAAAAPAAYPGDPFAACYVQLCQVSYFDPAAIPEGVTNVNQLDPGGQWQCVWGPAQNSDESNLAFVAAYFSGGIPVFAATVIRGTDVNTGDLLGTIDQIWEDLDPKHHANLPWMKDNAIQVAMGSLDGWSMIRELKSDGKKIDEFLVSFLGDPAHQKPLPIVTGHSLGGCLTTLVAPWLQFQLQQAGITLPMVPVTFAAPTAGNAAFAQYYDSSFPYALRFYNTLDIAPMLWVNLDGMKTIYGSYHLPMPESMHIVVNGFVLLLKEFGASYVQPFTNNAPLTGQYITTSDWTTEVLSQHHIITYMALMGVPAVLTEAGQPRVAPELPAAHKASILVARTTG